MAELRAGRHVCAVFYGHPGVFADVPHAVVRKARAEGIPARMEPGISAEACLYANLGLDPGKRGVQSMEATHFLVYDRQLDSAGLVLLWQVALAGDLTCTRFHAEREGLQALVDKLLRWYPPQHEVVLYEAARR
ncbi:MAG: SAM-dependent methyltransferase [Comamonadaceae bacterium]|nr:SAM-dependent methyltransferase [Comamonadaceae bacterium]